MKSTSRLRISTLIILLLILDITIQPHSTSNNIIQTEINEINSFCPNIEDHLWKVMSNILIVKLYDQDIRLFRETWGTREGKCWYWNTEQGEALLALSYLNDSSINELKTRILESYYNNLTYRGDGHIWLFSRYVPCRGFRILSLDPSNFSIGNFIINIGGDLAGTREPSSPYSRAIALAIDTYKDATSLSEKNVAWPTKMYVANIRSIEVYYGLTREDSSYRGIWDTDDGSLGSGKITSYNITFDNNHAVAYRVMKDNILSITQSLTLTPGAPYVDINMTVHNNWNSTLYNVRVSLPFDSLDWWGYDTIYVPGKGYFYASLIGHQINTNEKEYLILGYNDSWNTIKGWKPSIIYSKEPLGVNRALIVLVDSNTSIKLWGYGNTVSNDSTWYYRWIKYEAYIGDLEPGQAKTIKFRIYPLASYPSGLETLAIRLATSPDHVKGRDINYAVNTGTGAFYGLVRADPNDPRTVSIIEDAGYLFRHNHWNVSTRILGNYMLALIEIYNITNNETYLDQAKELASILISRQVRNDSSPLDGGFLDYPRPWGKGTYLDVGAEVAKALLRLYSLTGNTSYMEPVDYWLNRWFHRDTNGSWYYYEKEFGSKANTATRTYLESEPLYAVGYLVTALASHYYSNPIVLESISIVWNMTTPGYWVPTTLRATETNVETQSASILAQHEFLLASLHNLGMGIEYVRGGKLYKVSKNMSSNVLELGFTRTKSKILVVLYLGNSRLPEILAPLPISKTNYSGDLCDTRLNIYYYDESKDFLFLSINSNVLILKNLLVETYSPYNHQATNTSRIDRTTNSPVSVYIKWILFTILVGIITLYFLIAKLNKGRVNI